MRRRYIAIPLALFLVLASCGQKSTTTVQPTQLQKAAQAAAAIADGCALLTNTEIQLETAKVITPQVGLAILHARDAISAGDQAFIAILKQVQSGVQPLSTLTAAYQAVSDAVTKLTGIVITDPAGQQQIQVALAAIKSALAIIQAATGG